MATRPCVQPRTVSESEIHHSEPTFSGKGVGWTVGLISFLAIMLILASSDSTSKEEVTLTVPQIGVLALFVYGSPILVGLLAAKRRRTSKLRQWREGAFVVRRQEAQKEAATTTELVWRVEDEAASVVSELPNVLTQVREELDSAENEFAERAYGPFWDRIAGAAQLLATYRVRIERMTALGRQYSHLLQSKEHSFPESLSLPLTIPEPESLVVRLAKLAREGQKDYQFAVIWEHHKTRKVLVEGFSTLESTLRDIEGSLHDSLADCAMEISGAVSKMGSEVRRSVDRGTEEVVEQAKEIKDILKRR